MGVELTSGMDRPVRSSKIQVSRIAFYWAVLTVLFAMLWTISLNLAEITGVGGALSLAVPAVLAGITAVGLYMKRDHQTMEYDDAGYRILRGKKSLANRQWSEFKECSIIRDNYGRRKIRAYAERDGTHVDIDAVSCGVDPYLMRDFIVGRIQTGGGDQNDSESMVQVFNGLEKEIQGGRASWIADLSETFRNYQISGEPFPLVARGATRPKGFLLSRFLAMTVMPNYQVCFYAHELGNGGSEAKSRILRLVRLIETQRDQKDIKWSWLLLFSPQEPAQSVSRMIETFGNKDVGIGCIDTSTGTLITSPNQLGKSLSNQMRFRRFMRDLNRKKLAS